MSRCRSCEAPIVWARTVAGKAIPLDGVDQGGYIAPDPDRDGSVEFTGKYVQGRYGSMMQVQHVSAQAGLDLGDAKPAQRFMPHHATCPDGDDWRRG